MLRFVVLVAAVWVAFLIVRQLLRSGSARPNAPRLPDTRMVRCAHCGLHVPEDEALQHEKHYFCSEKHRLAGPR